MRARRSDLTKRQLEILEFIECCIADGLPPTVREIGDRFEISSPNGVECHLHALSRKGHITIHAKLARGIRLAGRADDHEVASLIKEGDFRCVASILRRIGFSESSKVLERCNPT